MSQIKSIEQELAAALRERDGARAAGEALAESLTGVVETYEYDTTACANEREGGACARCQRIIDARALLEKISREKSS